MRGVVMYGPGDVRVDERDVPELVAPTDAILRVVASCICGSDLWPWRGADAVTKPNPMGHEYVGVVDKVGDEVRTIKVGDFVVGSFFASDNTCEICRSGYQTHCVNRQPGAATGAQSEYLRVPLADGTLVATPGMPDPELVPSLLAASDVLGTGWFAAVAAEVGPGKTVAVVGGAIMLPGCGQREVQVSFSKDVMPILQASCHECHLPGGKGTTESGLLLDSYENLMKGTKFGPVVKPGNGLGSPFNQVLEGRVDKSIRMPHGGTQIFESKVKTLTYRFKHWLRGVATGRSQV